MNKNIMAVILSFTLILGLCCAGNVKISTKQELDEETIQQYKNGDEIEKKTSKIKIIENIFNNMDKAKNVPSIDTTVLTVLYGDVVGDIQDDAILTVKISSKNTIIVVYERIGNKYTYTGVVDNFFNIQAIQIVSVGSGDNLIIIREHADQMLGAYEDAIFLRAYKWDTQKFQLVLNILDNYRAYWNELWDNNKPEEESYWLLIKQDTLTGWKNNKYNILYVKQTQAYQQSNQANTVAIPTDDSFHTIKSRETSQIYHWSDKWQHYILGEATEIRTGEEVAILEDMEQSAFSLIQDNNKYRIKHKNGIIEFQTKDNIYKK